MSEGRQVQTGDLRKIPDLHLVLSVQRLDVSPTLLLTAYGRQATIEGDVVDRIRESNAPPVDVKSQAGRNLGPEINHVCFSIDCDLQSAIHTAIDDTDPHLMPDAIFGGRIGNRPQVSDTVLIEKYYFTRCTLRRNQEEESIIDQFIRTNTLLPQASADPHSDELKICASGIAKNVRLEIQSEAGARPPVA